LFGFFFENKSHLLATEADQSYTTAISSFATRFVIERKDRGDDGSENKNPL
jgi:hypothetical protein